MLLESALEVPGLDVTPIATVKVSVPALDAFVIVTGTAMRTYWPVTAIADAEAVPSVTVAVAALAGATEVNTPSPNADTATSAMRLIVVFVDIDFLSVVELMTFTSSAWVDITPPA